MKNDPIVAEIRRHRDRLAAKFNYNLDVIFANVRVRQDASGHMVVRRKAVRRIWPYASTLVIRRNRHPPLPSHGGPHQEPAHG